ncbi:DNA polymerase III subunit gamma/tau [Marinitoga sp. 1135]|uniref:DNA polymerase III subunit gamma/tau n=1 Tax=Marinitoga piezophila (strain DSM 14283 / JCM 11233 / KA3) TaxID=443254 RepID=H2J2T4_MARPK|nr:MULTISPECIES: DNA polymerase III subunit gamma/tau [Marinitoga]AEX84528.1 DNA polymerase III, subunit gamma/tau [Marinitoga piezophila KA3]APT75019.1 DNA polymerase III subunit gamma/tau [Marinitoga sp. 1137]NUU94775.1 DNA polymerase III subunit gamma/tau [Marinitoga sp. 1135]NUU96704.1 DNA polymerase III subunit gamma/tau [Marinitoga sp. 1138]
MITLYRKYRPLTFDELIGQEHIKKYFKNTVRNNEFSHAYIFSGPRGTGKTTTARILSKILNCSNPVDDNPCNKCDNCIAINEGRFMDVIELDAASNRGIDEIRKIRDSANFRPVHGKYKVYIIDEFHMLTKEAFNALLKTLEEPPEHVIFILATTNLEKVPETIVSRAQVLQFKNITEKDLKKHIISIAEKENKKITEEAAGIIAKKAKGGVRDSLSLLEQVLKFSSEEVITEQIVIDVLGLFDKSILDKFINAILKGDSELLLQISREIFEEGKEIEVFLEEVLEYILDEKIEDKKRLNIYIKLTRKLSDLLKELKYSENKKILFDIHILNIGYELNMKTEVKDEKVEILDHDETRDVITEDSKINKVLNILLNSKEKMDLSMYFALKHAEITESEDYIKIEFNENNLLEYQILKLKATKLELLLSNESKHLIKIDIIYKGNENSEAKKNNIIKLF